MLLEEPQVGEALEKLIRESLSAQWGWEGNLEGDDLEREVVRRRGLHFLGVGRDWEYCVWCGELVGPRDWAVGRTCAHQIHTVSGQGQERVVYVDTDYICRGVRSNSGRGEGGRSGGSCAPEAAGKSERIPNRPGL